MKQTIYLSDFVSAFEQYNRGEQFSYEALELIFDHLEEVEQDTGEEIELDVVAICCDFCEMSFDDVRSNYRDCDEDLDDDEVLDWLNDETTVVGTTADGVVFNQNF